MNHYEHTPSPHSQEQLNLREIRDLDPEVIDASETTKQLIELGLQSIRTVTEKYGTPQQPRWATGTYEDTVFMSYHNGGSDGHTSVGREGVGVPRNVLTIAHAVNEAAGYEVYDPLARAIAFNAAAAHDIVQLCGRSMLAEGQIDPHHGDERMSAEYARTMYLEQGGDPGIAQKIYDGVMATAFNPATGAQNVRGRGHHETEQDFLQGSLNQELVAAADLFSPTSTRGPLGALAYCVESLGFRHGGQLLQQRLHATGTSAEIITDMQAMVDFIDQDKELTAGFKKMLAGQSKFFTEFITYSDTSIRAACGKGIDELFPGRIENGKTLQYFSEQMAQGARLSELWAMAQHISTDA